VFLPLLAYSNSLENGFHIDDMYRVVENPAITHGASLTAYLTDPRTSSSLDRLAQYRPLMPLSFRLNYLLSGHSLRAYHAVNLGLHIASTIIFYLLALELLGAAPRNADSSNGRRATAFLAAATFGLHPVSGIVVNYISARDLCLMEIFLLGFFYLYVRMRSRRGSPVGWAIAFSCLILSLLSKTNAVVAPIMVALFEAIYWKNSASSSDTLRSLKYALATFLLVALHAAFTTFFLHFPYWRWTLDSSTTPWQYAIEQLTVHSQGYLINFLLPYYIHMSPLVEAPTSLWTWRVLSGFLFVIGSIALALRFRKTHPAACLSILLYWALMIPESSFIPLVNARADYRPYPSSCFLYLAGFAVAARCFNSRSLLICSTPWLLYLLVMSHVTNEVWRTEETLWTHSITVGADATGHLNYALSIPDRTDPRVKLHIEEALRLEPRNVVARLNLGLVLLDLGQVNTGLAEFDTAIRLAPDWAQVRYYRSVALERSGDREGAAREASLAAALDPKSPEYAARALRFDAARE
jgi:hypothetical protein